MKRKLMGLCAALLLASPMLAQAVPTSWTVKLDATNETSYIGSLVIDSSKLLPNTQVNTPDWLSFDITVLGVAFNLPSFFGSTEGALINAGGAPYRFNDVSGSFVDFCEPSNSNCTWNLAFIDGGNTWELNRNSSAVLRGTYSITAAAAVPEPATLGLLGLALAGLGLTRRRRSN